MLALLGIFISSIIYTFLQFAKTPDLGNDTNLVDRKAVSWCMVWLVSFLTDVTYIKYVVSKHSCSGLERTLYQNAYALPCLVLPLVAQVGDTGISELLSAPKSAHIALGLSCLAGAALSFTGMSLRLELTATMFTILGIVCKMGSTFLNEMFVEPEKDLVRLSCVCAIIVSSACYRQAPLRDDPEKRSTPRNTL